MGRRDEMESRRWSVHLSLRALRRGESNAPVRRQIPKIVTFYLSAARVHLVRNSRKPEMEPLFNENLALATQNKQVCCCSKRQNTFSIKGIFFVIEFHSSSAVHTWSNYVVPSRRDGFIWVSASSDRCYVTRLLNCLSLIPIF